MIINPIIPIWLMGIICVIFLFLRRKGVFNYIRQIIIVILLFVINLRIMVPGGTVTTVSADVDILFVCDNTISMLAEDYNGNGRRMDAVRSDCKYIVDQFPGASVSIITFDSSVEMKVPYTVDTFIVDQTFDSLNGEASYYANGSSLNMIMSQLEYFLDRGRDTYQLVFFVSDGEITMKGEELKTYDNLKGYADNGAVLGYGTAEGGYMQTVEVSMTEDEPEYLYYYDDNFDKVKAVSKINEENLKSIAKDLGVDYIHMTKRGDIDKKLENIKKTMGDAVTVDNENSRSGYSETYYYFLIPLIAILVFDLIYYKRKI
ncbi:MAG: VWA domain-containing protein [Lachnospiraceae bacterium]|nr:VWA domain-containing protein [Lachnospiraceae bacterium]